MLNGLVFLKQKLFLHCVITLDNIKNSYKIVLY